MMNLEDIFFDDTASNDIEAASQPPAKKRTRKRNPKITQPFTKQEKKCLLALLKRLGQTIWDKQEKGHKKKRAVALAWKQISSKMGKSVDDCKSVWKSLKDSQRYHCTKMKKATTGSACDLENEEEWESSDNTWEYAEALSFLNSESSPQKTFSSPSVARGTTAMPVEMATDVCPANFSSYSIGRATAVAPMEKAVKSCPERGPLDKTSSQDGLKLKINLYKTPASSSRKEPLSVTHRSAAEKATEPTGKLIELRQQGLQKKDAPKLKYEAMLTYLDSLLQKLPENRVQNLGFNFIKATLDEINKNGNPQLRMQSARSNPN